MFRACFGRKKHAKKSSALSADTRALSTDTRALNTDTSALSTEAPAATDVTVPLRIRTAPDNTLLNIPEAREPSLQRFSWEPQDPTPPAAGTADPPHESLRHSPFYDAAESPHQFVDTSKKRKFASDETTIVFR